MASSLSTSFAHANVSSIGSRRGQEFSSNVQLRTYMLHSTGGRCHRSTLQRGRISASFCSHDKAKEDSSIIYEISKAIGVAAVVLTLSTGLCVGPAEAKRREGVNRPELLPDHFTRVIDVAGFLSQGQEERLEKEIERLEIDTGYKLRLLAQNYPETPGLAIKDFWGVDDQTIVFVADPGLSGNILHFNVGSTVDLSVPRNFWSRLSGKYGNMFYWRDNGEDTAIEQTVNAIDACLREPTSPTQCAAIQGLD